jgi:tRNA (guanine-N7-)-methyltransferase
VENPARTAQFLAMMEDRRRDLRERQARILPPDARFTWEIGCGHGHFLTAYAQAHPSEICIGVDIVSERIERALRKRDRAQLANLHFIHAEARLFLETLPSTATFSRLFILFPDPWPKLRHHKHRIMQSDFLSDAGPRAGEGARLYFRTDYEPYLESARDTLGQHADWQLVTRNRVSKPRRRPSLARRATHLGAPSSAKLISSSRKKRAPTYSQRRRPVRTISGVDGG